MADSPSQFTLDAMSTVSYGELQSKQRKLSDEIEELEKQKRALYLASPTEGKVTGSGAKILQGLEPQLSAKKVELDKVNSALEARKIEPKENPIYSFASRKDIKDSIKGMNEQEANAEYETALADLQARGIPVWFKLDGSPTVPMQYWYDRAYIALEKSWEQAEHYRKINQKAIDEQNTIAMNSNGYFSIQKQAQGANDPSSIGAVLAKILCNIAILLTQGGGPQMVEAYWQQADSCIDKMKGLITNRKAVMECGASLFSGLMNITSSAVSPETLATIKEINSLLSGNRS